MFGKPLEEFIGEVRKFQMGNVTWEYTVKEIQANRAIVEMVCKTASAQLAPVVLYWDRGELGQHGFN